MAHEIKMGEDGILRISFIGDLEKPDMDAYIKDLSPFLQAATEERPLQLISDSSRAGKYSFSARKSLSELNQDARIGRTAIVGANRITRVLVQIILKASKRDNIRIFINEPEALSWLKNSR